MMMTVIAIMIGLEWYRQCSCCLFSLLNKQKCWWSLERDIKVTTLSVVSYASVYEQTHSRQCCNLFISWLRTQPVIVLPSLSEYSTPRLTARLPVLRVCAMFEGLTRVLLRTSIWFLCQFAGFHVVNRAVTRLLLLRRCMKCFSVFL